MTGFSKILKKTGIYVVFFLIPAILQAQSISGTITDKNNKPLIGTAIKVLTSDSIFIKGDVAGDMGRFEIKDLATGMVIIQVSYIGFRELYITRQIQNRPVFLGTLILEEKTSAINEVTITGQATIAQQKGDTTQYNAGAFKTNPDATAEDLVNKMPGMTTEEGKLKSQGEDVKRVLVDGKPFFGDDPGAVLKNLPAEVIDKIQVFDGKSDQSQLTGFDDGNTSKTINIITKTQFRNGVFGKVYAGYGNEEKWKAGYSVNFFKDKRRITILGNSNNINEQNFTAEDLLGVMSSSSGGSGRPQGQTRNQGEGSNRSGGRQGGSGSEANNFLVDQKNGISTTNAFGVNYSNSWKKIDITGSYFFNYTENNSLSNLNRQFISNETSGLTYSEKNNTHSKNTNQRFNLKFDWKMNSKNALIFQPRVSFQNNDGTTLMTGENKTPSQSLSSISNTYESTFEGSNFSAPLMFRHTFNKKGRAFSINLIPGYNKTKGNSHLDYYSFYNDTLPTDTISQNSDLLKTGYSLNSTLTYTEPINTKSQVLLSYSNNFNKTDSRKNTIDNKYSEVDTSLSNTFNTTYQSQSVGLSYRYQIEKWNFTAGVAIQSAKLQNEQVFPAIYNLDKTFYSVLPNVMFQYKYTTQKNLRISYNISNNAPSADQLQQVINNKNPLLLTTGNTDLKQDWQNNLSFRYSAINTKKNTAFFALLGGTFTQNFIVNSNFIAPEDTLIAPSIILNRGSQISSPVNLNGYYNLRSFINYSFPVISLKSKINLNASGNQNRTPSLINGNLNYANSTTVGLGIAITSNVSEKLDFTISSNSNYNLIKNTLQANLNSTYINQNTRFKIQANPWKGLILQTDLSHQYNTGLSSDFNQKFLLWNASLGYKFLKDKQAELRVSVYDILKQNNIITRNTTETYYEDVQTNILQRFIMLTFTYNLKFFKEKKVPDTKSKTE